MKWLYLGCGIIIGQMLSIVTMIVQVYNSQ